MTVSMEILAEKVATEPSSRNPGKLCVMLTGVAQAELLESVDTHVMADYLRDNGYTVREQEETPC